MEGLHIPKTYHIVYKTTNIISGSFYIGVHSSTKLNDRYLGSGKALHQALKTYGRPNFIRENLMMFDTKLEAYEYEKTIVTEDFVNRFDTSNLCTGGRVPTMTQEIKDKISKTVTITSVRRGTKDPEHAKRMFGNGNSMFGRSRKGEFAGSKNGMYGKGDIVSGENNPMFKGYFITPKGKFGSATEALPFHPEIKSKTTISNKCKRGDSGWSFQPKI